jgi:hypothetical protein
MPGGLQGARFLPMPLDLCKGDSAPGRRIRRSGIPSKPGLMNLGQTPPAFFTAKTSLRSSIFSFT